VSLDTDPPRALHAAAHRRLGLCAWIYAYRALAGLLIALPMTAAVSAPVAGYPRGQAELFDPGGVMLVESLRLLRRSTGVVTSASSLAIVAFLGGVLPLGALIAGLGREGRLPAGFAIGRALRHAGTLALLFGLGLLAQAIVGAILGLLGSKLVDALTLSPMRESYARLAIGLVVLAWVALIGVVRDLASVAAVHGGHRFYVSAQRGLGAMRRAGGRALFAWSWRSALGLAGVVLAAWLAPPLAGAGAGAVVIGVALHQAGIAGAVFGRASWLAAAIGHSEATAPTVLVEPEPAAEATAAIAAPEPTAPVEEEAAPEAPATPAIAEEAAPSAAEEAPAPVSGEAPSAQAEEPPDMEPPPAA
jgi:hypothetical protein